MPHDFYGNQVKKGDIVTMTFEVIDIFQSEDSCNVNLKSIPPCIDVTGYIENIYKPVLTCNARMVAKTNE